MLCAEKGCHWKPVGLGFFRSFLMAGSMHFGNLKTQSQSHLNASVVLMSVQIFATGTCYQTEGVGGCAFSKNSFPSSTPLFDICLGLQHITVFDWQVAGASRAWNYTVLFYQWRMLTFQEFRESWDLT